MIPSATVHVVHWIFHKYRRFCVALGESTNSPFRGLKRNAACRITSTRLRHAIRLALAHFKFVLSYPSAPTSECPRHGGSLPAVSAQCLLEDITALEGAFAGVIGLPQSWQNTTSIIECVSNRVHRVRLFAHSLSGVLDHRCRTKIDIKQHTIRNSQSSITPGCTHAVGTWEKQPDRVRRSDQSPSIADLPRSPGKPTQRDD